MTYKYKVFKVGIDEQSIGPTFYGVGIPVPLRSQTTR